MNIVLTIKKNVKMKKTLHFWLMALLVGGLSMAVTSCKDDDKDDGGNNDNEEYVPNELDETDIARLWLTGLTDAEGAFADNWDTKTYEPSYGIESETHPTTRIISVTDIEYARQHFASVTGLSFDKLSTVATSEAGEYGTLTWTPSAAGADNLAVVDVNTKLIPHLTRIVYCRPDQIGDNGDDVWGGTSYYRLGDVIEDTQGYYWVCVRPAFGPNQEQESLWVSVINASESGKSLSKNMVPGIPNKNIYSTQDNKWNSNTILLPTELGSKLEHTHYFSSLIWALLDPVAYHKSVGNGDKSPALCGYEYQYHGEKFLNRVAEQWTENHIWEKLFNRTYDQMKKVKKTCYYYAGYHWKFPRSTDNADMPLHITQKYEKTSSTDYDADRVKGNYKMKGAGYGFDVRRYCGDPKQNPNCASTGRDKMAPAKQFSDGGDAYWVIRGISGHKLHGVYKASSLSIYSNIKNVNEVYRYNSKFNCIVGTNNPPETEANIADAMKTNDISVGAVIGLDSKLYASKDYAERMGTKAVALVVYLGGKQTKVETGTDYNGLAIALPDALPNNTLQKVKWCNSSTTDSCLTSILTNYTQEPKVYDGVKATGKLNTGCDKGHEHPAVKSAQGCDYIKDDNDELDFGSWFLPSVGQFKLAVMGLGGFTWSTSNGFGAESQATSKMEDIRKKFAAAGVESYYADILDGNKHFWTTTLLDKKNDGKRNKACTFFFKYFLKSGEDLSTFAETITDEQYVLPFLPFKYTPKE